MSLIYEERPSDSPYIETITHGWTVADDAPVRPAECHWHMVFVRHHGRVRPVVVGPLTTSGVARWKAEAEILWVKFKLGVCMPHLPLRNFLDVETILPEASSRSFWLKGSVWQIPDFENIDTFIDRLARAEILTHDPVVPAALAQGPGIRNQGSGTLEYDNVIHKRQTEATGSLTIVEHQPPEMAPRTVRHRFVRATGLTQSYIRQMQRAQQAAALLQQGTSIADTVYELGYFDQPHLTRSLKRFIGHTPAQIARLNTPT